jgi:glycerol kinase
VRAAILGLTRGADKRHVARGALESIALQCNDLVSVMEKDSGKRMPSLKVDGGATRSSPLMQFQADLLERPLVRPANIESTAMGAAFLAGNAIGWWSAQDLAREPDGATTFKPHKMKDRDARLATWKRAVATVRSFGSGHP